MSHSCTSLDEGSSRARAGESHSETYEGTAEDVAVVVKEAYVRRGSKGLAGDFEAIFDVEYNAPAVSVDKAVWRRRGDLRA